METLSLENCIRALKGVRDAHSSQLDTSITAELNEVIADLESIRENGKSETEQAKVWARALQIIAVVLHFCSNIKDWMK